MTSSRAARAVETSRATRRAVRSLTPRSRRLELAAWISELICHWYDAGTSETLCGKPVDTLFLVRTANDRWTLCKDCVDQRTEDAEHWMVAPWKAAYEPV